MSPGDRPSLRARVTSGLTRGGTQWLLTGSLVGGLAAYLFQVVGARALGAESYAPIATLWTIQYLVWSVFLYTVETYVNREVVLGRVGRTLERGTALRIGGWMLAVAIVLTGMTWVLREGLFYGVDELAVVTGLIVIAYGVFAVVRGRLAGLGRFKAYGLVSASESVIRLALAAIVALTVATTRALGWIMPLGAFAAAGWWFVLGRRRGELVAREPAAVPPRTSRFLGLTTVTNAAVQVLLAGAPLVVVALGAGPAEVSVVFVTMTAARVPVVLALGGLLSRLLPTFVRIREVRGDDAAARVGHKILLGTLVVAAAGAVAGGLVGGPLIAWFFGAEFTPAWWFAGATGAGVLLATGGMLLNQLLIARGLEHRLPGPWYAGVAAASVTVVLVGGSPSARVAAAFVAGELVAVVALVIAARRPSPRPPEIQ